MSDEAARGWNRRTSVCLNGPMLCLLSESLEHSVSTSRPSSLLCIVLVGHELSSSNPEEVLSMWETALDTAQPEVSLLH